MVPSWLVSVVVSWDFFLLSQSAMDDGWWMIRGIYMYCIYIYMYISASARGNSGFFLFFGLYVDRIFFHGMDVRQSSQPSRGGGIIIYSRMLLKFD